MLLTFSKRLLSLLFLVSLFLGMNSLVSLAADPSYGLDETINVKDTTGTTPKQALLSESPQQIVGRVIGALLAFVGVLFFGLMIYGGLRWMLAQGDEGVVDKSKQTIIAAVTGLIIVLAAYAITAFIGQRLTQR